MKTTKSLGLVGGILVFLGGISKMQHYPGANIMIMLGDLLLIVFLFLWISAANKNTGNMKEKNANLFLSVVLFVALIGLVFKMQHYPGASIFPIVHFVLLIILIPVYLIYISSEQDKNKGFMRLSFLVFYLAIMGFLFVMGTKTPYLFQGYVSIDKSIITMTENVKKCNENMYLKVVNDSSKTDKIRKIKELSKDMNQYITQLRKAILITVGDDNFANTNEGNNLSKLNGYEMIDIPTDILIGEENNPKKDANSAFELKSKIIAYRGGLLEIFDGKSKEDIGNCIGLRTDPIKNEDLDKEESWEIGTFNNATLISDLVTLDQLQYETVNAESVALTQLLNCK